MQEGRKISIRRRKQGRIARTADIFAVALCAVLIFVSITAGDAAERVSRVVVIDPAHGGGDAGVKLTDKISEKTVTLAVAKILQKDLAAAPLMTVRLTRSDDRDVSTADRLKFAREAKADVFISLHINAGFGRSASGYEFYFPGFSSPASETNSSADILKDMTKNKHLNDSVRFAQILQKNLESVFPRKSRWLREAPVPVLEGLGVPGVVIELGFATNTDDRKRISDEEAWKAIARALGRSLKEFF